MVMKTVTTRTVSLLGVFAGGLRKPKRIKFKSINNYLALKMVRFIK